MTIANDPKIRLDKMKPQERFDLLQDLDCVCCWLAEQHGLDRTDLPEEIHHLNMGGQPGKKRRGHRYTIKLCVFHHKGSFNGLPAPSGQDGVDWLEEKAAIHGPSWAQSARRFREFYGTDDYLLELTDRALLNGWPTYEE